ncbi:SDR family oxidoreductase [Aquirhabdus parva]|uniref:NAD(P)-dependent oxidoreductase n=1 Tax=Aquirhabdus parva TaxID=2283318 RepID=A0A345P9L6_9GAMM|nr:NAD(P)-dependent oxidoreductase [Aquirhabdus parva]AXI03975.1 NAD(P)-dependent oxidoreductase [Aquirhabdus parva]
MTTQLESLRGKTLFITGGSRGIGRAIALRAAADGANVVIAAKTAVESDKLVGSVYSVAEEVVAAGGKALPLIVDVRDADQVIAAMAQAAEHFGGIDILVNNAGAINLMGVEHTSLKKYDLIQTINHRATFICAQAALPYLKKSTNAHILSLSPPVNMAPHWLKPFSPYALSKYGMTILTLGMAEEFRDYGISCNTLWPATYIATAAVAVNLGGENTLLVSRKPEIMADAAHAIFASPKGTVTGHAFTDEESLARIGVTDLTHYACSPDHLDKLQKDFFLD